MHASHLLFYSRDKRSPDDDTDEDLLNNLLMLLTRDEYEQLEDEKSLDNAVVDVDDQINVKLTQLVGADGGRT